MSRKNKLFTIGDISKFTGASIKSLRYYEEIKVLKPAHIDLHSGYRYYTFDQIYLIEIIMYCIELDIPLKELTKYIDKSDTVDLTKLLAYGKGIAQKKLKTLQRGLQLIENIEQKIAITEKHNQRQGIYTAERPEKIYWLNQYEQSFEEDIDLYELFKIFGDYKDDYSYELLEYGYLCEYSPSGIKRYVFMELPKSKANANIRIIPAGTYYCRQSENVQIEQASDIFKNQLKSYKGSFLAIETEIFVGKYKINKPLHELCVIGLS